MIFGAVFTAIEQTLPMLKSFLVVAGTVAGFGLAHAAPERRIVAKTVLSYTEKTQRFAVWLPTPPARTKTVSGPTPQGEIITMFFIATGIEPIFYTVVVAKHPPSALKLKPAAQLDFARDAMMQNSTSKILSSENIRLGAFPGREIKMTVASGTEMQRMRIYTTPKRLYQVVARSPKANFQKYNAQITKVFDSLRILSK